MFLGRSLSLHLLLIIDRSRRVPENLFSPTAVAASRDASPRLYTILRSNTHYHNYYLFSEHAKSSIGQSGTRSIWKISLPPKNHIQASISWSLEMKQLEYESPVYPYSVRKADLKAADVLRLLRVSSTGDMDAGSLVKVNLYSHWRSPPCEEVLWATGMALSSHTHGVIHLKFILTEHNGYLQAISFCRRWMSP